MRHTGTPPHQPSRRLRVCPFGLFFYPNAISSSQKICHVKPAAQSICTERRKILPRLVITDNPPEGDQRQEKQPGVHSRLLHPARADRQRGRRTARLRVQLDTSQAGAGGGSARLGAEGSLLQICRGQKAVIISPHYQTGLRAARPVMSANWLLQI